MSSERPAYRDESGATPFYSSLSKIDIDVQREILDYGSRNVPPIWIAHQYKIPVPLVKSILDRGIISPRFVKPYRCKGCGHRVVASPCMLCESKQVHGVRQ